MKRIFSLLITALLILACLLCASSCYNSGGAPTDPSHTHSFTVKNTDGKYLVSAADCDNTAKYYYSCACGEKGAETFTDGEPNGHNWILKNVDEKYFASAADCNNAEKYYYSCACGNAGTETFEVGKPNGHSFTEKNIDDKYFATAADCKNAAKYYYSCACGEKGAETFTDGEPVVYRHNVVDGYCAVCGGRESTFGLEYTLNPDRNGYTVTGIGTCTETDIFIGVYNNLSVTSIGEDAFRDCANLSRVVLNSTVKHIDNGAFYGCTNLKTVTGLENVVTINKQAFQGCDLRGTIFLDSVHAIADYAFSENKNLKAVVLPEVVRSVGAYAFAMCEELESVTVNAKKIELGEYAFFSCSSLAEIDINASVIPACAFMMCSALTDVKLGADVSAFGEYAFTGTSAVFDINEYNPYFKLSDSGNAIISTDGGVNTLVLVSPSFSGIFTLKGFEVIGDGAFSGNERVTSVNMPDAHMVGKYAFSDCIRLANVTLAPLTAIGDYAFFNTPTTSVPAFDSELTEIGKYAFAYTDISSVIIPEGVSVLDGAFCECQQLKSVIIGDGVRLGTGSFMLGKDSVNPRTNKQNWEFIPVIENGKTIYCYRYLSSLVELTIGDGVEVGDSAFLGAASLIRVSLGEGVKIGNMAFYNNASLSDINLEGVLEIGEMAFSGDVLYQFTDQYQQTPLYDKETGEYIYRYYAPAFTSVTLTDTVKLGSNAFQYCISLTTVIVGDAITEIPAYAFANCTALNRLNLEGVVAIGEGAFLYSALAEADLSAATEIGDFAFAYSFALASITLNTDGVDIGEGVFGFCISLTSIVIPDSITNIGVYTFCDCWSLTTIKYCGTEEQWNAITKGYRWDYNTGDYTITYNYTDE